MSYPQPTGADSVVAFEDLYRLNTTLDGPGDIYELDVSCSAFLIGPDSDIAQVKVTMFDPTESTRIATAIVTPDRSFNSLIEARIDTVYPQTGNKKGRILISPKDLYNGSYIPAGYDATQDIIKLFAPKLDVMAYFSPQPSLVAQRSDRLWYFEYITNTGVGGFGIGDDSWVVVPFYGRKYGYLEMQNLTGHDINVEVRGVNYIFDDVTKIAGLAVSGGGIEKVLSAPGAVANLAYRRLTIRASADGEFDAVAIKYTPSDVSQVATFGPIPTRFMTSDDAL